jgi:hypothetical protein
VKKHPDVLPFISLVMLSVLTLGHLSPLVLNFEALFLKSSWSRRSILRESAGWLEANEVMFFFFFFDMSTQEGKGGFELVISNS